MKLALFAAAIGSLVLLPGCDNGSACEEGEWTCSDDALVLSVCEGGAWTDVACMADHGQLCEGGECVDPWRYGAPVWDRCEGHPQATPETLAEKMQSYEDLSRRLHVHPTLKTMMDVDLAAGVTEAEATWADVATWRTRENDGLWSSLYLTSQAYRYGATRDAEALEMIKLLLEGEAARMRITSVPGVFTRQMIPPDVPGIACPTDLQSYIPDAEKDDNMWVRIGSDGCIQTVDGSTLAWVSSDRCGLEEFDGWCWLDNVSQDEYAGHMLALAATALLVDDAEVQAVVRDLLQQIGTHLVENDLEFIDWDGRRTEHGWIWPTFVAGGFMAAESLAYLKVCAAVTGDPELQDFYDNCLLMRAGEVECFDHGLHATDPYDQVMFELLLYLGTDSCGSNWNNFAMEMLYLHTLLLYETDPELRATVQRVLDEKVYNPPDEERPLIEQKNAFYDFIFAADKALGPGSDGPALDVVERGICVLRQFPASEQQRDVTCPAAECVEVCVDRNERPLSAYARLPQERCPETFLWWGNPYSRDECAANPQRIFAPSDYLLPYWMGRYYGFITADM